MSHVSKTGGLVVCGYRVILKDEYRTPGITEQITEQTFSVKRRDNFSRTSMSFRRILS